VSNGICKRFRFFTEWRILALRYRHIASH
jgi:hypothetical protein